MLEYSRENDGDDSIFKPQTDGRTPLSKAAGRGHLEVVKLLLEEPSMRSAINTLEGEAKTPLHRAAYNGRGEVVDALLDAGADATIPDNNVKTALALCNQGWSKGKKSGDWESTLVKLIACDPKTVAKDEDLLFTAAIKGSAVVVEKLLDAKADANRKDEHGWSPLQHARQYGHVEVASLLSRRGAEIGSRPSRWVTEWERIKVSDDGLELEYLADGND
jgi:ankyrin repeat protein